MAIQFFPSRPISVVLEPKRTKFVRLKFASFLFVSFLTILNTGSTSAQELNASDGAVNDFLGGSVSLSGNSGLVGAPGDEDNGSDSGSAYLFRGLDTTTGTISESVKLLASDGATVDVFGDSVGLSGGIGLVGARRDDDNGSDSGSAYVFRNLDTATGTINESAKLLASDAESSDFFGTSVSVAGNTGLVGALQDDDNGLIAGAAYLFRNLDTATGTVNESAKLLASDGALGDRFGSSVSQSGHMGLVGAFGDNINGSNAGSAYVFRNLDTATGVVNESVKLVASDVEGSDFFGSTVSLSGNIALVGSSSDDDNGSQSGSAYLFRNLDAVTGTINESAKLLPSDGDAIDLFGVSVSVSGNTGLVGSIRDDDNGSDAGAAYIFSNLDTATGTINETVKLLASDGLGNREFGRSVSLEGDRFTVGASRGDGVTGLSGSAYTGTVSSMTTLDTGNASAIIDSISFDSRTDWIVGETTSNNHVTLTEDDSAEILSAGKAVFVGDDAGSNENSLTIAGNLDAFDIFVGDEDNFGNQLIFESTATFTIDAITLFANNQLLLEGDFSTFSLLDAQLGATDLFYSDGTLTELVTADNFGDLLLTNFDNNTGYTSFSAVPEPSAVCHLVLGIAGVATRRRKAVHA